MARGTRTQPEAVPLPAPGANGAAPDEQEGEGHDLARASVARLRIRNAVNALSVAGGLVILVIVFSIASPYFFTTENIYRVFQQVAVVTVLAIGQSFVIYTAGIDLSQGAVMGLCAVMGGDVMVTEHSIFLGVVVALAVGCAAGAVSGLLITRARLVPFIATLAMLGVASGGALLFTGGEPVFNIPKSFYAFGSNGLWVFPYIVMVAAAIAIVAQFYSTQARGGRYIYAIGSNERGAKIAGIRSKAVLLGVYAFSGLLAGVASMLQVAYVNSGQPTDHTNLLLESIAAVVLGGGSLFGGEGMIWGTAIGALLIAVLYNGTELLGISSYVQTILLGVVVVLAVSIDNLRRRERVAA
jgi:ribose transport system permease protein